MPNNFSLEGLIYNKIANLFASHSSLLTQDFEKRIKQSIRVLHFAYLWGACREAEILISKQKDKNYNLFDLIMLMYSKRRKEHSAKFLLLHCFEVALRSTMAVCVANYFNRTHDDWFLQNPTCKCQALLIKKTKSIINLRNQTYTKQLDINDFTSFKVFDLFSMGDLEYILKNCYEIFENLFNTKKIYKNQVLPIYGTKASVLSKINQIRNARNEIFHNKPTRIKFQKDLEILLLRFGYNLKDALNIGNIQDTIYLHYKYQRI